MEKERELFEELGRSLHRQREAMMVRNLDDMQDALKETEKVVLEIEKVDGERHELFKALKRKKGLDEDAPFEKLLSTLQDEEKEAFMDCTTRFLWTLNELAEDLQGIKDMLEFENSYFEFLMGMLRGDEKRSTYSKEGYVQSKAEEGIFDARW